MFPNFQYASPIEFVFGPGRAAEVPERLKARGVTSVLVVTDEGIVGAGLADRVEEPLRAAGISVTRFTDVKSNPTVENVDAGAAALTAAGAQAIIGLGGGSPIDAAKIIAAAAANGCTAHQLMTGERKIEVAGVPQIAIPTTAGSGAESAKVSVLVDHSTGEKKGVFGPGTAPWVTILDPELMLGLPAWLTAATGMDALSHALEAFLGLSANPFSDALAEQSMRLVAQYLERAVDNGKDLEARSAMTVASALGGLAKEQSGLGILHAVAMPLGYLYDLHHGYLCAALMAATLDFNRSAVLEKTAWVARTFGVERADDEGAAAQAGAAITALNERIGLGMRLTEAGVRAEDHDRIVDDAMQSYLLRNNPVPGTPEGCRAVLSASM
ncbi:MAG: iron-containing alcohol dehydrogenase [Acidimicrobiales bacterium]|nr:iron-containing alcohol dehydrogenase [Acidimicrobiales bacterium]